MSGLYALLMLPAFDPRPWGTVDLSPIYPNHKCEEKIGEAWLTGDHCKVRNGPLAGQSLAEISARYGGPGSNNGRIPYSVREGATALGIGKTKSAELVGQERRFKPR